MRYQTELPAGIPEGTKVQISGGAGEGYQGHVIQQVNDDVYLVAVVRLVAVARKHMTKVGG